MRCVMLCWRITGNIKQFSIATLRYIIFNNSKKPLLHISYDTQFRYITIWELVPRIQRKVIQRNFITSNWISTGIVHWNILIPQADRIRNNTGMITLSDTLILYYSLSSIEIDMVAEENHPSTFLKKYC